MAFATAVASQQDLVQAFNPAVNISSCQALSCSSRNGSICSTEISPGPEAGVGIAAEVVITLPTNLSLTLIDGLSENGFTGIGSDAHEFSDQQLFVGVDPSLNEEDYPSGCVLMMQYQGQTFPLEALPEEGVRSESSQNTTSCDGVIDIFCQSAIVEMIQSFNAYDGETDRCKILTQHVSSKLQDNPGTCGGEGTWIANFFNVTGGGLPSGSSEIASNDRLGDEECRPVLPQSYRMYKVAEMRSFTFADAPDSGSDFYSDLFGGRAGFTPVVTVVFPEDTTQDRGIQFSCMKTLQRDGEFREGPFESGAHGRLHNGVMALAFSLGLGLVMWL
ncbi:uncharacterized protein ColSpa_11960 [Colletotrichum spaethianum]|uniref:Uncharacterized protein n=1 Tax=Colletotrichum spaethianum TaxID=700344 RepID=A0AA37UKU0_9PEZI|nr:uncharacterized protein ColSpa_11960 [Colletotrichum spaethianum]GKT51779.1 hypothetical protein ColSpa_11960 [Colletotrichum spaethianum]